VYVKQYVVGSPNKRIECSRTHYWIFSLSLTFLFCHVPLQSYHHHSNLALLLVESINAGAQVLAEGSTNMTAADYPLGLLDKSAVSIITVWYRLSHL